MLDPSFESLEGLDELDALQALQLVARVRDWTLVAAEDQMARARAQGYSWRKIAAASGVSGPTVRRWAAWGAPEATRRRVASL